MFGDVKLQLVFAFVEPVNLSSVVICEFEAVYITGSRCVAFTMKVIILFIVRRSREIFLPCIDFLSFVFCYIVE